MLGFDGDTNNNMYVITFFPFETNPCKSQKPVLHMENPYNVTDLHFEVIMQS